MKRLIFSLIFFFVLLSGIRYLYYLAEYEAEHYTLDSNTLLNRFYSSKDKHTDHARDILLFLLRSDPQNHLALQELGYWYLNHKEYNTALKYFKQAFSVKETAQLALQIAELNVLLGNLHQAEKFYQIASILVADSEKPAVLIKFHRLKTSRLYDTYYKEKKKDVMQAQNILRQILYLNPEDTNALVEMGLIESQLGNSAKGLTYLRKAFFISPTPETAAQLGYTLTKLERWQEAKVYFTLASQSKDKSVRNNALQALNYIHLVLAQNALVTSGFNDVPVNEHDQLLNEFYQFKEKKPEAAWRTLSKLLKKYPGDLIALKEAGFFVLNQKNYQAANYYFTKLYILTHDPEVALQLGYVNQMLEDYYTSYNYFFKAAFTGNPKISLVANKAMTNFGGLQTKTLPDPWFAEIYEAPIYLNRFKLIILPLIGRVGTVINQTYHTETYFSYRYTKDDRSGDIEGISQIFEDNVEIFAGGIRSRIFPKIPLTVFFEGGRAKDLIYRDRPPWRADYRAGLIFYQNWGVKPTYVPNLQFGLEPIGDLYGDFIYFSRFDNNFIGSVRLRQGFRVIKYHASSADAYLVTYVLGDTNHEFFNNVIDYGGGFAFTPYNRYNCVIRYELLRGHYIPVNSPTPNPYPRNFRNYLGYIELFLRI